MLQMMKRNNKVIMCEAIILSIATIVIYVSTILCVINDVENIIQIMMLIVSPLVFGVCVGTWFFYVLGKRQIKELENE